MRVAIDTGFLSLPPSGTGLYVGELLAALPAAAERQGVSLDLTTIAPSAPLADRRRRLAWETAGLVRSARTSSPRPDLVHIPHQMPPPVRPVRRAAEVVTVHDLVPYLLPEYRRTRVNRLRLFGARWWLHRADRVIVPSRATANDLVRVLGISRSRIALVPMAPTSGYGPASDAADLADVRRVRQRYGLPGRYVFNVGGYDARKNLVVLLAAFARVVATSDDPDLRLVIGGAPHSTNAAVFPPLAPVIRRLGLGERVVLTGKLPAADLLPLHRGASVYCTPSTYEGFGLTPLDAMACGVPVIVADRTSLPEVVGDAGLLVQPTTEGVATALRDVLSDELLARRLRHRSVARAAEYSWSTTADLTLGAYQAAIASRRGRR